jgi:hypothetical protein
MNALTPKAVGKSSSTLTHWLYKNSLKETNPPKG